MTKVSAHFHFVRHLPPKAEAYANAYGCGEVPLDTDAPDVIARIAQLSSLLPADAIWCISPTPRTDKTAMMILEQRSLFPLDVDKDEEFIEQNFGVFADMSVDALRVDPAYQAYKSDPINVTPPGKGGESFTKMFNRVGDHLDFLASEGGAYVINTHGGPVRAAVGKALGLSPWTALKRVTISPLMHVHIEGGADRWRLHEMTQGCAKRQPG